MTVLAPQPFRWTRELYDRMVEAGILGPETRVQLIDGEVIEMTPQGSAHTTAVHILARVLQSACPQSMYVRIRSPLALDGLSEPEPDIAVVTGAPRDYYHEHPHRAELVIEVAESSLSLDRTAKQRVYARTAIPEYWIANLAEAALEVYRDPQGEAYAERTILKAGDSIAPLPCPDRPLAVVDLLP